MTSPARIRVSPPTWGPTGAMPGAPAARARRAPGTPAGPALRRVARLRRAATDLGPDAIVGLALLAGWTLLWVFFLVGVLEPASSLRLVR